MVLVVPESYQVVYFIFFCCSNKRFFCLVFGRRFFFVFKVFALLGGNVFFSCQGRFFLVFARAPSAKSHCGTVKAFTFSNVFFTFSPKVPDLSPGRSFVVFLTFTLFSSFFCFRPECCFVSFRANVYF